MNIEEMERTFDDPTKIISTFEGKHKAKLNYFCANEFFRKYFNLIKKLVQKTEYIPAVLLTADDYDCRRDAWQI